MRAALIVILLTVAFYWKLAVKDQYVWFDHPDMAYLEIPRLEFMAREIHAGRFPLWDPHIWMGQPLVGQAQPGPLNPLNILFLLLPLKEGYLRLDFLNWYWIALHALAALGMYALCRELRRSRTASVLAACAFALGGFLGSAAWLDVLCGGIWTPLVCLYFVRAARGRRPLASAALSGLFLGLTWLSGHHEVPLLVSLALGVAWLAVLARRRLAAVAPAALTFLVAGLTGAAQLWPMVEFGRLALRWGPAGPGPVGWRDVVSYLSADIYSLTPRGLAGILLPDQGTIGDALGFMGVTAIFLAGAAAYSCWRSPVVRWFTAAGVLAIAYAMGAFTPLHGVLYAALPELHKARVPVRALHLVNFALAVLTAYGADRILSLRGWGRIGRGAAAAGALGAALVLAAAVAKVDLGNATVLSGWAAIALCIVILAWRQGRIGRQAVVAALAFLMLTEIHMVHTRAWRHRLGESGQPFARALTEHRDLAQFLRTEPPVPRAIVNDQDVPANFGDLHSVDMAEGYVAGVTLNLHHFGRHMPWAQRLYSLTHYVGKEPNRPDLTAMYEGANGVKVFRVPDALPRARAVHEAVAAPDVPSLVLKLEAPDFDPGRTVVLVGGAPELEQCEGSSVSIVTYAPNRVRLRAKMACRGMVILSDTNYPGWRARVDGREARIWDAYGALRGVVVEAGEHEVDFRFRPVSVFGGLALTGAGVLLTLLLAIPWRRAKKSGAA
jgi:hypothetical protein